VTEPATEDAVGLSPIGRVFRRRWRLLAVFAVAGAALGAAASPLLSPGYETSASVLLQGPRAADELLTEAQVAGSSVVLDRAAANLGWGVPGSTLAQSVTTSVADGNVIEVTAVADSPERAQQLADRIVQEYVAFSTQLLGDTEESSALLSKEQQQGLRDRVNETMQKISALHESAQGGGSVELVQARTQLESLRTGLGQALTKLEELGSVTGQARMAVMGSAQRPTGPAAPTMVDLAAGGAAAGLVLGLFGHLFAIRLDKRLRDESRISSALGSTLLGSVDVADEPDDHPKAGLPRRLLGLRAPGDLPWHAPDLAPSVDEHGLGVRYRRVLARLVEQAPAGQAPRVVAVVADDDPVAARAAARLTTTSATDQVRVVEVAVARPTVPDLADGEAGAIVVVTAGTRTAWELVAVAEACADAGHDVLGVVVAVRAMPPSQDAPAEQQDDAVLAGST
jgi:capsular polysaccharide biosynthesis protein